MLAGHVDGSKPYGNDATPVIPEEEMGGANNKKLSSALADRRSRNLWLLLMMVVKEMVHRFLVASEWPVY
ncbi:hypothetical protein ACOMHN_053654 [Nucella lapillus]